MVNLSSNTTEVRLLSSKPVFWLFRIGSQAGTVHKANLKYSFHLQAERLIPDRVYTVILILIFIFALITHLPSFCILIRDYKRNYVNNANLIYRNLFVMDIILLWGFLPFEIYWTLTRHSLIVCRILKCAGFIFFFGGCCFVIILAVDRCK